MRIPVFPMPTKSRYSNTSRAHTARLQPSISFSRTRKISFPRRGNDSACSREQTQESQKQNRSFLFTTLCGHSSPSPRCPFTESSERKLKMILKFSTPLDFISEDSQARMQESP